MYDVLRLHEHDRFLPSVIDTICRVGIAYVAVVFFFHIRMSPWTRLQPKRGQCM